MNFAKFIKAPFLTEHLQWLLLTLVLVSFHPLKFRVFNKIKKMFFKVYFPPRIFLCVKVYSGWSKSCKKFWSSFANFHAYFRFKLSILVPFHRLKFCVFKINKISVEHFIFLMFLCIIVYSLKFLLHDLDLFYFVFNSRYQVSLNFVHFWQLQ